jgi:coenzyme F420 hydrogenase subunit beta
VKNIENLQKVMRSHLCNRCGTCVGLSHGAIVFTNKTGAYRPHLIKPITDELAETLWEACAGKNFDFKHYKNLFYSETNHFHEYIGPYQNLYIGNATNPEIRSNGASGGIITGVLIYLLESGKIDGAVTLRMSHTEPWLSEPFIATTRAEILESAQSKYTISSVNEILDKINHFEGNLAFSGLPGQIQSIRKLQAINHPSVRNIKYLLGPFYGNTLHFSSIKSFLRTHREKDYTQIEKLYFRHGEWPGNMRVEMKSGRIIELKKFHANYLIPFHILKNSLYCTDLTNEFTDISGGDAWAPVYEERGKGFSMVISRSKLGQQILDEMEQKGLVQLQSLPEQEAISMHSHGYDLKKRGTFIRIKFRKWMGKSIPDFGYTLKGIPAKRYVMEIIVSSMFSILGTRLSRWVIQQFSPTFIGNIFEKARTRWKKSTYKIKRSNLS